MSRQQRRYKERQERKEELRKQSQVISNLQTKMMKIRDLGPTPKEYIRGTPEFMEMWVDYIEILHPQDIKEINVHKFELSKNHLRPYTDDFICVMLKMEQSIPTYEDVEVIDLKPFHEKGMVNGLNDMWEISNTGWFSTRNYSENVHYHPFVVFDRGKETKSLPLDSKFLILLDDNGENIYQKELPIFDEKFGEYLKLCEQHKHLMN